MIPPASASLLALSLLAAPIGVSSADPGTSVCRGTPSKGRVEGACPLPPHGPNFVAYSPLGVWLLRTWTHCTVRAIVEDAYGALAVSHPRRVWVYGEAGLPAGGRFWPHRTHQNGLSVDFMSPLSDRNGPRPLPLGLAAGFGYGVELDREGRLGAARLGAARLDAAAVGDHLLALQAAAQAHGARIAKVILDPALRRQVQRARPATRALPFTRKRVWVRHDDHYHVDFALPCDR